jgi:hypothetical protein
MSEATQAEVYLRLRAEYLAIHNELAGIKAELKRLGADFVSFGNGLQVSPDRETPDRGVLIQSANDACDKLARYQDMLVRKTDKKTELSGFSEPFTTLPD